MIEVIYKEEKAGEESEPDFCLPRNIRQIGLIHENYRIYMEDYVYTFLGKVAALAMKTERQGQAAILTGEIHWKNGVICLFIRGALLVEETEIAADHILLEEQTWEKLGREQKQFFSEQEVVGWFLVQQGMPICSTEILTRAHVKYFGGEKVLFLMEPAEHEDAFFRFENNFLVKQSGYYLYYEKNEAMQNYMLSRNDLLECSMIEKTKDEAVKNFRKIIQEKNESKEETPSFLSYVATACLVLAIGAVGFRMYQSYQEIQEQSFIQEATSVNSSVVKNEEREKKAEISSTPSELSLISEKNVRPSSTLIPEQKISLRLSPTPKLTLRKKEDVKKAEQKAEETTETNSTSMASSYVVKPGDSLFQICLDRYGTADMISELCDANGFSEEEVIYPGQIIVLP